jgi:hypothetical protein
MGAGTIDIQKGAMQVKGNGTQFTPDDVNREIRIESKVYRISAVQSATLISLTKPFPGVGATQRDASGAAYSLGPKLVGPSWEVRLPTMLVMIDTKDDQLPQWLND